MLPVLLILTSCGVLTPTAESNPPATPAPAPKISEALRTPCDPLPDLEVKPGTKDMRPELLSNRAASALVHQECTDKHLGVLNSVGVAPAERKANRRQRLDQLIDRLKSIEPDQPTTEGVTK